MKTYIAGPMSGYPDANRAAFMTEAARQTEQGHIVLNPAIWPDGLTQAEYMQLDLAMVMVAERIVMLPGWRDSAGACAEHALATKLGHAVEYVANTPTGETLRHTVESIDDGWIEWNGGDCPVDLDTRADVELRNGSKLMNKRTLELVWRHHAWQGDIIAYRVVKP